VLLLVGAGCSRGASPAPSPPTIEAVGVATDVRFYEGHVRIAFADGTVHEVAAGYRQIGDSPGFNVIIIGSDSQGPFVASFPTQAGLPPDCFREHAEGIERGAYIETEGVLWSKAASFASPVHPDVGSTYPGGTRFCFNGRGLITEVIGPEGPRVTSFDSWTFSSDRRSITVGFTGDREFDPDDPCSIAYRGTAAMDGDELVIGIYAKPFPGDVPKDLMCTMEGHSRSLTLQLGAPFHGTRIRDLAGQVFFLEAPPRLVQIGGLPEGWVLQSARSLPESPTGRWARVYAPPGHVAVTGSSVGQVELIQAFGAPANVSGGDPQPDVIVNGETATFYFWASAGEFVLVWKVGADGVALVGNIADFTQEQFIAVAKSVAGSP
jgi:hypothetical protein